MTMTMTMTTQKPIMSSSSSTTATTDNSMSAAFSEIHDRIQHMKRQESTTYQRVPLTRSQFQPFRHVIVDWMYHMAELFQLDDCVVSVATYYLDKTSEYTTTTTAILQTPTDYQLASLTCFHMAMKVIETKLFPMEQLLKLGQGIFVEKDVIEMERKIIGALQWYMHPPTPTCFLEEYLQLLQDKGGEYGDDNDDDDDVSFSSSFQAILVIRQTSRQLIRMASPRDEFAMVSPSILAYASMMLAMETMERRLLPINEFLAFIHRIQSVTKLTNTSNGLRHAFQLLEPLIGSTTTSATMSSVTGAGDSRQEQQQRDDEPSTSDNRNSNEKTSSTGTPIPETDSPRNVVVET